MSQNARAQVTVVIAGEAKGLDAALKEAQSSLKGFGAAATRAGAEAGTTLAAGEAKAGGAARTLTERMTVAADAVGLLGIESGESVGKVFLLRDAMGDLRESFGGLRGMILGGIGAMAAFGAASFLKESVTDAMAGEAAWARLTAAYKGNAAGLQDVKRTIEDTRATWEKLGLTQAQVADMAGRAAGMGLDPTKVLGDPAALADVSRVLGTDIPAALDAISKPRGGMQVLARLGLSKEQINQATAAMKFMTAAQRVAFIEQQVEASRFAGAGLAAAGTASGKFLAFNTALADLREEVGNSLIPALTQLATALTGLLQGADALAKPFGGLGTVLKVLFIPMLAGGLLLFTNLRGAMTRLVDLLLGRLVGAFGQTAEALAEDDTQARHLADDLNAIPELVTTTAAFIPATAVKDAYKANIYSIPREWTTTATFVSAEVPAEPVPQPISVPVTYEGSLTESQGIPVHVPVIYDGSLTESQGAPVRVPVIYNGLLSESRAVPVRVPVIYAGHLTESRGVPVRVPVIYAGHLSEAHSVPVRVPVIYKGVLHEATVHELTVPVQYAQGTLRVTGGTVPVEPVMAPDEKARAAQIRAQIERDVEPVEVPVRAHWARGAISGLKEGLAFGAGVAITDAIFNSVTIKHVAGLTPPAAGAIPGVRPGGGTQTQPVAISGTPRVYVTNLGPIGEALPGRMPHSVSVTGHPYVGIIGNQSVGLSNVPTVKLSSTVPIQNTVAIPSTLNVKAAQAGHWEVNLAPDALKRFGEMVGEIAIGTMLGNVFMNLIGKIPFGKIVEMIRNLFTRRGGKGGGGGEGPDIPLLPQWSQSTASDMLADLLKHEGVPLERSLVPVLGGGGAGGSSTFIVTGLVNAIKAVNWGGILGAALSAGKVTVAIAGGVVAAFGAAFALIGKVLSGAGGPSAALINPMPLAARLGTTVLQAVATGVGLARAAMAAIGTTIIGGILGGIKAGLVNLENAFIAFFNKILSMLPFGAGKKWEIKPIPVPHGAAATGLGPGSIAAGRGASGLSRVDPSTVATLRAIVSGGGPSGAVAGAGATYHQTYNATFHVDGAQDPVTISRQINRAFAEFVGGVRSSRRLHG